MRELAWPAVCIFLASAVAQGADPCANLHNNEVKNGPPIPQIPMNAFSTNVKAIIINRNMTVDATEYADEALNAGALVMYYNGTRRTLVLDYNNNQVYSFASLPGTSDANNDLCTAQNLTADVDTQLFGGGSDGASMPHMFSTSKILQMSNQQVYKGKTLMNGVPVNKWSACMYWAKMNSNFTVDYYFTAPNYTSPSGPQPVPVQAEVQGFTKLSDGSVRNFHHIYKYINFQPYINDPENMLNTPPGVFCLSRPSPVSVPKLKNSFYYQEEIMDPDLSDAREATIWYNYDLKILRVDSRDPPLTTSTTLSGTGPYTVIHDFTTGVQYAIDQSTKDCSIDPIPTNSKGFDAALNITRDTLSMRNPQQFFYVDGQIQYAGLREVRGVQADVFQKLTDKIPNRGLVVYEIYFLRNSQLVTDVGPQSSNRYQNASVPVQILMWENNQLVATYNIYDFDQDNVLYGAFDITPCYEDVESVDFQMALTTSTVRPLPGLRGVAVGLITSQIATSIPVSPLRLQNLRLTWTGNMAFLKGTLVDKPPPTAKFEYNPGKTLQLDNSQVQNNIRDVSDCASQCNNLQSCTAFDYCPSSGTCKLATGPLNMASLTLLNNTNCDFYQRVIGDNNPQPNLMTAWVALKNIVFGTGLKVDVPLNATGFNRFNGLSGFNPFNTTRFQGGFSGRGSGSGGNTGNIQQLLPSQKITLTGRWITNQVAPVNAKTAVNSLTIQQFTSRPGTQGKGSDDSLIGISVDECAVECAAELSFNCQSFSYCYDVNRCFMSRHHPDEDPSFLRRSASCDTYTRNYTSNYEKFDGQTVLSTTDTIYQSVVSDSACAKLCTNYNGFHCESFDYCSNIRTCFLGQTHYYDIPKANIQQTPSCAHYSRSYLDDFVSTAHKTVYLRDNRIVTQVSAQQCAKLCVQEPGFTCMSFDYCTNTTECRLSDASVSNTGQVTLEANAYCDVFSRRNSADALQSDSSALSSSSSSSSGQYSGGSMAGLAIALLIISALLSIGAVYFFYFRLKNGNDSLKVSYEKEQTT